MFKRTLVLLIILFAMLVAFAAGVLSTSVNTSASAMLGIDQYLATPGQISSIETANLLLSGEIITAVYIPAALKP